MEILISHRKFKEAFETVVHELETDPDCKEELRDLFVFTLTTYCDELKLRSEHLEALNCYEKALHFYGKDSEVLNELGSFFAKHNQDEEAKELLEEAYKNDHNNLKAYQNLQNLKNKMARWHFRMLNDAVRNSAFKKAIQHWVRRSGKVNVLDIGSGTGLLSMYAANVAAVKSVHAIEYCGIMSKISAEVFKENLRGKLVTLVPKHSKDLVVGEDIPEKASLIVSETLDCAAFGEGILDTCIHATQNLLAPGGKIVPWKVRIHVAGYKSKSLSSNQFLLNDSFSEYIFMDNFRLVAKNDEPYDAEFVDKFSDFKLVTNVEMDALEVDFNNLESMQKHFDGTIRNDIQLNCDIASDDYLDGFVTWFTLFLNEADESNVITTAPKSESCWPQAIFKLRSRFLIERDETLKLLVSCKDGVLEIYHDLDIVHQKIDLEVDPSVLRFLNDDEYLRELEFAIAKHKHPIKNCLDFSPFPYVGLMLLKESRIEKLYCRKKDEGVIRTLAKINVINDSRLEFVDGPVFDLPVTFNLIILHPFHRLGVVDSRVVSDYPKYVARLENCQSMIVPQKITVFGELINSDALVDASRITNLEVRRLKIDKFINKFATEIYLDMDASLDHEKLSAEFKISEVFLDEDLHETVIHVPVVNTSLPIQAIFYHHKIKLTGSSPEFSTNRKTRMSCFKRTAQVLVLETQFEASSVAVSFQQNSGIVKCDVIG